MHATTNARVTPQGNKLEGTKPFLDWIDDYRRRRGWNYSEFAEAAGVAHSVLSRWFKEDRRPRPEVLERMASKLGVDVEDLLGLAGYPRRRSEHSPEHAELIAKLEQISLTPDRFRMLETLLEYMRRNP